MESLGTGLASLALWRPLLPGGHEGRLGRLEGRKGEDGGSSM